MRKKNNKVLNRKDQLIFQHKDSIKLQLILVFLIPFLVTFGILIEDGIDKGYLKMYFGMFVFLLIYVSFRAKTLNLYLDRLAVIYSMSPFLKSKTFQLEDIDYFKLIYGGTYDPSRLVIYLKNKRKKVYHFGGRKADQQLIDKLREMDFEVIIGGSKWK